MSFTWAQVPDALRAKLLQSGVGKRHVFEIAHDAFQAIPQVDQTQRAGLYVLACDMLLTVWESACLDLAPAVTLHTMQEQQPFAPPKLAGIIKLCARQPQPDSDLLRHLNPGRSPDAQAYENELRKARRRNENAFCVLSHAFSHGFREHRLEWLRGFLRNDATLPAPLMTGLLADVSFAENDWAGAVAGYARAYATLPLLTWEQRRGEALYRAGQTDEAAAIWRKVHAARPWQINMALRLSDVLMGRDTAPEFPPGNGAVLLYTWNKAGDMDATLASLAASELSAPGGETRIFALDNGSTDATPDVYRKWEAHFAGRMTVVTLPVNVGAPAARNWLLALPEVRRADWAAFLDDDVAVPADWLRRLWSALRAYPDAGVVSGHAVDYHAPMNQQWTDMHIIPLPVQNDSDTAVFRDRFKFSALHEQAYDFGDFTFMRPCVTAIGCCHMFTRRAMDEGGTFDIRFSPSQSDDVDHDMRRGLNGHLPIYNGHLRVLHKRSTGYHKTFNRRGWASAVGNWYKLQASYSAEEVAQLHALDQKMMWDDLQQRLAVLA